MDAFTMQCAVPHVPLDVSVRDASMKAAVALAGVGPAGEALHAQQTNLQLARASSTGQRLDLAKAELNRDAWLALETALEKLYAEAAAELAGQELLGQREGRRRRESRRRQQRRQGFICQEGQEERGRAAQARGGCR